MPIDVRTPEDRQREARNIALMQAKRKLADVVSDLDFLIVATPTGKRRNTICDVNIHVAAASHALHSLVSEEKA
jgi:hypothetical protein